MKLFFTLLAILSAGAAWAQQTSNLILFSEHGEPFYASINSVRQNTEPMANVQINDLTGEFVRIQIDFKDQNLGSFQKNFMLETGMQATAIIKKNKKGAYVLRPFGQAVAIQDAPATSDQPIIVYHDTPSSGNDVASSQQHQTDNVQHTVVTETTTVESAGAQSANVQMNVGGNIIQAGVQIDDNFADPTTGSTVTHTTTSTTTTTTTSSGHLSVDQKQPTSELEEESLVPGYNGPVGCGGYLMSDAAFAKAKQTVENQSFADDKLTVAKQIANSQCLTTAQVAEMMSLFSFEDSKIEWAKTAYNRTYDVGNYWMLNDHFTFSSSVDELNKFIQSRK